MYIFIFQKFKITSALNAAEKEDVSVRAWEITPGGPGGPGGPRGPLGTGMRRLAFSKAATSLENVSGFLGTLVTSPPKASQELTNS